MSEFDNELLGLAEDGPRSRSKNKKPKSQAYIEDSEDSNGEMDMDLESEEDDLAPKPVASSSKPRPSVAEPGRNPYPLEGRYIDEDDRDQLEAMPEMERETILATRLEEMQKFKDALQLDAMYKMAGGRDDNQDEEEEDDSSRKKRKHTSVTKEASKAMTDLKKQRIAKDERSQRRAARRERKARSASPDDDSHSTEDGEIDASYRRSPSPAKKPSTTAKQEPKDAAREMDLLPCNCQELNAARLSRYELVDMSFKEQFEEVIVGAYVRLMAAEPDPMGRPKYRLHRIVDVNSGNNFGQYAIEYKSRTVSDNRVLVCQYGEAQRLFRIADVSNGDFDEGEFSRFIMTSQADSIRPPKRSDLKRKHEDIKQLRDRAMTDDEINRQIEARRKANPLAQRSKTILEISSLMSSRNLALRRNDHEGADEINRQIVTLGGNPATGQISTGDASEAPQDGENYDSKLQRINENKKRRTKEAMSAAHAATMHKKRAEDAMLKTKRANAEGSPAPPGIPKPFVPSASALKKGETPQQLVARTIELDIGDF